MGWQTLLLYLSGHAVHAPGTVLEMVFALLLTGKDHGARAGHATVVVSLIALREL